MSSTTEPVDFRTEMDRAALLIPIAMQIPVEALQAVINRAHSVGHILDPTAYRDGMGRLEQSQAVVRAVAAFQRAIRDCPALMAELVALGVVAE